MPRKGTPARGWNLCPAFPRCGGCTHLDQPYARQVSRKLRAVRRALSPVATAATRIDSLVRCPRPTAMRAKTIYPVALRGGRIRMGFFESGTHRIVDSARCVAQTATLSEAAARIRMVLDEIRPSIYDERRHRGSLRHLFLRHSITHNELLVMPVTTSARDSRSPPLWAALVEALREIRPSGEPKSRLTGLVQNINDQPGNTILGPGERVLWGRPWIEETIDEVTLRISAQSFFQVNPAVATRLYRHVVALARSTGARTVVDAFCGVGPIALLLATRSGRQPRHAGAPPAVHGIESSPSAIRDARFNGKANRAQVTFEEARVEHALGPRLDGGLDLLVVDPPRAGLGDALLATIARTPPRHLIYVSCSPVSLARDAARLVDSRLMLMEVRPFDLFPHTEHVEIVARFESDRPRRHDKQGVRSERVTRRRAGPSRSTRG